MSSSRGGPASRNAIDPAVLVAFVDAWSQYSVGGFPRRKRLLVNGTAISENDARMIRRWRAGGIKGVTVSSAHELLGRHNLTLPMLETYCEQTGTTPTTRGKLPRTN